MGDNRRIKDLRDAATLIKQCRRWCNNHLQWAGVRHSHDADGDRLGDSPEASMVRVHARAALGALEHLAASLENLATKLDLGEDED